ncbi:MAG: hypothetical protein IJ731_08535 [Eubacterium sp.]|nr:hypothetical protein [Eubacterium sp.]
MTPFRKASIKKLINTNCADSEEFSGNNIFYTPQKGSEIWGLIDDHKNKSSVKVIAFDEASEKKTKRKPVQPKQITKIDLPKRAKTPEEKLYKKIFRQFKNVKYIGDIPINNDEYDILIDYLKIKLSSPLNYEFTKTNDPIFNTALVQIGIREYNSRFWPHVQSLTGVKLDGTKQRKIGERFYNTLIINRKIHIDKNENKNEIVNNILMHCFVTKHYASDFFEFLFAYYQYDLGRDLEQHKEMRDHLIDCMKKAENSPRAFRIKKCTADAATANEKGCKIRVYNILKWMDAYLFEDKLPENSPNRTAQFFVEWAKTSKRFSKEKSGYYSRGKKRFRYPYLHFDMKNEDFQLKLPVQTVPLSDDEDSAELSWIVIYKNNSITIESETENTVIGCRNIDTEHLVLKPEDIFSSFKIELIKNETETIKRFAIRSDTARFFDSDYDYITGNRLPEGDVFAFVKRDDNIETDGYYDFEHYLGLDFYSFQLTKGNIIKKPDGRALSVGQELQEGLIEHNLVTGAAVYENSNALQIFSKAPSILIKMKNSTQAGTLIIINGEKYRLDSEKCIIFKEDNSEYNYYLIRLDDYCNKDDIYYVVIDVPFDRKIREYCFVQISNFDFDFLGAPYVFKTEGKISFCENLKVTFNNTLSSSFDFAINGNTNKLLFDINGFEVHIDVPVFKWKFNLEDEWNVEKPEELWHKEFPDWIYFSLPTNSGCIFSDQEIIDEEESQRFSFAYDANNDCFICDTRKIKSWLEFGSAINHLYVQFDDTIIDFFTVVTSCILVSCSLANLIEKGQLIIKSTILGFSDCVVDIYNNGNLIADKLDLTSNGAKLSTDKLYGDFELVFLEYNDDDNDFGEAVYSEFGRKKYSLKNQMSLLGKKIEVQYITEDKKSTSIFSSSKYDIKDRISVMVESVDDEADNIFYGVSNCANPKLTSLRIQIEQIDAKNTSKALIFFYDEEEECYVDFVYDKRKKTLLTTEDFTLSPIEARNRYLAFSPSNYYYITISK